MTENNKKNIKEVMTEMDNIKGLWLILFPKKMLQEFTLET